MLIEMSKICLKIIKKSFIDVQHCTKIDQNNSQKNLKTQFKNVKKLNNCMLVNHQSTTAISAQ